MEERKVDIKKITSFEHEGHNTDWKSYFKRQGQWFCIWHDNGWVTAGEKVTEETVLEELAKVPEWDRQIAAQGGRLRGGARRAQWDESPIEEYETAEMCFQFGEEQEPYALDEAFTLLKDLLDMLEQGVKKGPFAY